MGARKGKARKGIWVFYYLQYQSTEVFKTREYKDFIYTLKRSLLLKCGQSFLQVKNERKDIFKEIIAIMKIRWGSIMVWTRMVAVGIEGLRICLG